LQKLLGYNLPEPKALAQKKLLEHKQQILLAKQKQLQAQQEQSIGEVLFQLTSQGDMNVKVTWDDNHFNDGRAKIFGEFLFHVCNGTFEETLRQVVIQIAMQDVSHRDFVKKAIEKWKEMREDKADNNDEPAISPLAVFNMTQTGNGGEE